MFASILLGLADSISKNTMCHDGRSGLSLQSRRVLRESRMSDQRQQAVESHPIYIAGNFKATDRPLDVISPYSGRCVYRTFLAGERDLEDALEAACFACTAMRALPVYERYRILMAIAQQLQQNRERFATMMAREAAKPFTTALTEVDRAVQTFNIAAEESRRLPGELLSIDWTPAGKHKEGRVKYFPVGVVAGISPFNFPLNLVAHKIAPAIAAGCPMVLKPASKTPITALVLAEIIDRIGLPDGGLSVMPMDRDTGNRLVTDPRIKLLSFTGSPGVGWRMKHAAGKKKVVLELGGNAALIVARDADLDKAAAQAVKGGFSYAGQSCIHTQRIFVERSCFQPFIAKLTAGIERLRAGDPEHPDTDIAVMIDRENAERIEAWVREAQRDGATVLVGGQRRDAFYEPTVLTDTGNEMKVCALEAFAPIVVVEAFTDFKAAVDAVNDSEFGLQAGLFTYDSRKIHYAFERLEVGGVLVNEAPTFRVDHMPYGGVKDSGLGREGPKYAIMEMMEPKILITDHEADEPD